MRPNPHLRLGLALLVAVTAAWGQASASVSAPASPAPVSPSVLAGLESAVNSLRTAVDGLDPDALHAGGDVKSELAESRSSLQRNLREAVPGLLASLRSAPGNAGAGFRLYRDLNAVLTVTQRSADSVPLRGGADQVPELHSAAAALQASLESLGNWIETQGAALYDRVQQQQRPVAQAPIAPPKTVIINDANGVATPPTKARAKKPAKP